MAAAELRCPACAVPVGRVRRRLTVGSPFEECPKCRALVGRPSTKEWDLLRAGEKLGWFVDRAAPFLVLGIAPGLAYPWLVSPEEHADPWILIALLCAGPLLLGSIALSGTQRIIRRSRSRMADPMYRARLVEFERRRAPT